PSFHFPLTAMYGGVSENLKDVEGESDREEVPKTNFEEVPDKSIFEGNSVRKNDVHSEDPFDSLKYPPGFTPNEEGDVLVEKVDNWSDENRVNEGKKDGVCEGQHVHERGEWGEITYYIGICSSRFKRKKMLWDYLSFFIWNWDGEVVTMGDFNELCDISERFGSLFNKHGAEAFNSFIVNAGLVEVPLGGCSFTWCHKSTKKMSKLDRFLISDNLMCSCPSISSTSLDRFLLDHRPIIMHDAHYERGLDADGHRRREVVRLIQEVEKVDAMKMTQKAKIKWSIEGDKKSKYYHGVLNKKRGRLTICKVLVDGIWMESPHLVNHEFFEHFKNRFEKPNKSCIFLERDFVKRISLEQNDDLERKVSNEEIKRARLVTVLDDIVDEIQFAFVTDRQILDGPCILNEIVHCCKNKKKQSMIFKVDFEKARICNAARILLTLEKDPRRIFEGEALMRRMNKYGLLDESQKTLNYVLALTVENFLERRIYEVGRQVLNVPSFKVRVDSQKHIKYSFTCPFGGDRPGRVKRKNQKATEKKISIFAYENRLCV
nr:40S ribosomal protein S9-2-like [Tanacetum cinerariifolium]